MRALAWTTVLLFVAGGCGGGGAGSPSPASELKITLWNQGRSGLSDSWTVRCPGDAVCDRLSEDLFEPVPPDVACTEIYGGPEQARVEGTFRGRKIDASFDRTNGCEIRRWDRIAFLFARTS